jgi:hypothetical protein
MVHTFQTEYLDVLKKKLNQEPDAETPMLSKTVICSRDIHARYGVSTAQLSGEDIHKCAERLARMCYTDIKTLNVSHASHPIPTNQYSGVYGIDKLSDFSDKGRPMLTMMFDEIPVHYWADDKTMFETYGAYGAYSAEVRFAHKELQNVTKDELMNRVAMAMQKVVAPDLEWYPVSIRLLTKIFDIYVVVDYIQNGCIKEFYYKLTVRPQTFVSVGIGRLVDECEYRLDAMLALIENVQTPFVENGEEVQQMEFFLGSDKLEITLDKTNAEFDKIKDVQNVLKQAWQCGIDTQADIFKNLRDYVVGQTWVPTAKKGMKKVLMDKYQHLSDKAKGLKISDTELSDDLSTLVEMILAWHPHDRFTAELFRRIIEHRFVSKNLKDIEKKIEELGSITNEVFLQQTLPDRIDTCVRRDVALLLVRSEKDAIVHTGYECPMNPDPWNMEYMNSTVEEFANRAEGVVLSVNQAVVDRYSINLYYARQYFKARVQNPNHFTGQDKYTLPIIKNLCRQRQEWIRHTHPAGQEYDMYDRMLRNPRRMEWTRQMEALSIEAALHVPPSLDHVEYCVLSANSLGCYAVATPTAAAPIAAASIAAGIFSQVCV